tara:strand:+ start:738 stop:1457 length:720 start_codon:yes stop_codon:yes gene_type:complete
MSKIKVNEIEKISGSGITIPTGTSFTVTDGLAASTISSGTLADARIPNLNASKINAGTIPVARGGTGLASLGSAGQVIKVNSGANALEFGTAPSGKILQYKHVIDATNRSTTSSSYTQGSSGLQLVITPSATSSKIFILANFTAGYNAQNNRANYSFHRDISGGTQNAELAYSAAGFASLENRDGFSNEQPISYAYVDSPNTTSACTYYTVMKAEGGNTAYMGNAGATGHLFLMELDGS